MKCDRCDNEATVHEVTIRNAKKVERHLCENCAREQGIDAQSQAQLGELITKYVMAQGQGKVAAPKAREGLACPACHLSFAEFRKTGLLGCAECYKAFEAKLAPLLERAHGGASHHVGKVPRRALGSGRPGGSATARSAALAAASDRAQRLALLRKQLEDAVSAEQYERAAKIRDDLRRMGRVDGEPAPEEGTAP